MAVMLWARRAMTLVIALTSKAGPTSAYRKKGLWWGKWRKTICRIGMGHGQSVAEAGQPGREVLAVDGEAWWPRLPRTP